LKRHQLSIVTAVGVPAGPAVASGPIVKREPGRGAADSPVAASRYERNI